MEINLNNIEQLIFFDKKLQVLLPEYRHLFDQWQLGQRVPGMKTLAQRSILDLLNSLNKKNITVLEEYFKNTIVVEKINHKLVAGHNWHLNEDDKLCQFSGYRDFCVTRTKDNASISFWR